MREKCDKCGSDILMGECSCGQWFGEGEIPDYVKTYEAALLAFHKQGKDISSGDHHTGVCYVFFRGNYDRCAKVVEFLQLLGEPNE